ncbi:hypothetical protein [Marinifilum sp. D737]|uniref:hypothetical protein n=1 Tax=Marinifilum sp. D737 TaxID=2969628 RepID=UPI002273BF73|nr:hypothetical protein [Marinifilum sp. D737]MCY1634194.1 hypothetical protein [Marinifilum sp. D737]
MKKIFLLMTILSVSLLTFGQEKKRLKEVGLVFSNLDEFGFVYKVGHEKSMWRFNVISLNNSKSDVEEVGEMDKEYKNTGFNFSLGKEYYSPLTSKFQFKYGWDVFYRFSNHKEKDVVNNLWTKANKLENKSKYYGVNFILGVNYPINDHIVLGAEVTPAFSWDKTTREVNDEKIYEDKGHSWGFSNNHARITLAYRF